MAYHPPSAPEHAPYEALTDRELEILQLLAQGLSNREVANRLVLAVTTVKWYVRQIFEKLGVNRRREALAVAQRLGLLEEVALPGGALAQALPVGKNPYKGLRAFQQADVHDFFGREALTRRLLARLGETGEASRFLAVVGPSGSGKSSAVRAGLLPALQRGELAGAENWLMADLLPGSHPFDELELALRRVAANPPAGLIEQLQRDERGLLRASRLVLPDDQSQLLLLIDQFEELFTLVPDAKTARRFLDLLYATVTDPHSPARVLITLRADFYDRPLMIPDFSELVRARTEVIVPLTPAELEEAIVQPAQGAGVSVEPGLTAALVAAVNEQPGTLPLLQYALTELFDWREGRTMTLRAYERLGGVLGALTRQADEVYDDLVDQEQALTQQMFLRLVTLGEGTEDLRRRVLRSELTALAADGEPMERLIDTFGASGLLTFDRDMITNGPTVEVAHEALLREWGRLRSWLEESRADIKIQRQIALMTNEWRGANQDSGFLARGGRLTQFEAWAQNAPLVLNALERAFLDASLAQRVKEAEIEAMRQARERHLERRSRTFLRGLVLVLTLALIGAFGLTAFALDREGQAQAARVAALSAQATSEANFARAEQQRLFLAADSALSNGATGNIGLALALRSLSYGYTPEADAAVMRTTRQGFVLHEWSGSQSDLNSVMYSPDGALIAVAGEGSTLILDSTTGDVLHTLTQGGVVTSAVFSPTGTRLLTTDNTPVVRLWDVATGEQIRALVHRENVQFAYFSQDGAQVIVQTRAVAQLWETETGARGERISLTRDNGVSVFAYLHHPSQSYLVVRDADNRFTLEDAKSGDTLCALLESGTAPLFVWWSDQYPYLVIASGDNIAYGWNFETCMLLATFSGHSNNLLAGDYDPHTHSMVTMDSARIAYQWSLETGGELARYVSTGQIRSVDIAPDGSRLIMPNTHNVAVWDMGVQPEPRTVPAGFYREPYLPHFSPDGQSLFVGGFGRYARWDLTTQAGSPDFTFDQPLRTLDFSPDGRMLIASMERAQDFDVYLLDSETGAELRTFAGHWDTVNFIDVSRSGRQFASGSFDYTARSWDISTGEELHVFRGHEGIVSSAVFSPDETLLVTSSTDGTVRLWNTLTGAELHDFEVGAAVIYADFSPDGRLITASDTAGFAHIWDVATKAELHRLVGHTETIWTALFSPDGTQIVTASWDGTARIWDVASGQTVRVLDNGRDKALYWAEFSPDGAFAVTGGEGDDRVDIWRVDLESTITALCDRPLAALTATQMTQYGLSGSDLICPSAY